MTQKVLVSSQFQNLPVEQQFHLLRRDGVHVGKRKIGKQAVILFQLYSFYVEVYYLKYRRKVGHLIVSDSTDILQPYLDQIQVRDLPSKRSSRK